MQIRGFEDRPGEFSQRATVSDFWDQIRERASNFRGRRRGETRFSVSQTGSLYVPGESGGVSVPVQICDVSRNGVSIELAEQLKAGIEVLLDMDGARLHTEVRHCTPAGRRFRAGLRIVQEL